MTVGDRAPPRGHAAVGLGYALRCRKKGGVGGAPSPSRSSPPLPPPPRCGERRDHSAWCGLFRRRSARRAPRRSTPRSSASTAVCRFFILFPRHCVPRVAPRCGGFVVGVRRSACGLLGLRGERVAATVSPWLHVIFKRVPTSGTTRTHAVVARAARGLAVRLGLGVGGVWVVGSWWGGWGGGLCGLVSVTFLGAPV